MKLIQKLIIHERQIQQQITKYGQMQYKCNTNKNTKYRQLQCKYSTTKTQNTGKLQCKYNTQKTQIQGNCNANITEPEIRGPSGLWVFRTASGHTNQNMEGLGHMYLSENM